MLEDDGILVFQVAGIRPSWQYEDLIWCVPPPIYTYYVLTFFFKKNTGVSS